MEGSGLEGELGAGYMRVPWSSWDQWKFVEESLFSSSHDSVAAALRRITAWKSRGCLPVAVEVTARIVEIQHMDPFFRKEVASDTINSEDMLAMLYSIALIRLVNGFVGKVSCFDDHAQKHGKKKHSISDLADAIGMPRMVVDIRHESSHQDLPSLPLVRRASTEALQWLKSHYWEPQRRAIPDVQTEIKSKLLYCMKTKQQKPNPSQLKEKRECSRKKVSKISKIIAQLYTTYPYEVVSVLLEIFQSPALDPFNNTAVDCNYNSASSNPESCASYIKELKNIIHRSSRKKPGLLLTMLKEVLGKIETKEGTNYGKAECHLLFPDNHAEIHQIKILSSLVPWLLLNLKEVRESNQIALFDETQSPSASIKFTPKISLREVLRKCLFLSSSGNKHLTDSAICVAEMIGNSLLIKRTKELALVSSQNIDISSENSTLSPETSISQEEESIKQAIEKFDLLKSRRQAVSTELKDVNSEMKKKIWAVAKGWTPCPIGTLPCTFSSTAFLPVLDQAVSVCLNDAVVSDHEDENTSSLGKREASHGNRLADSLTPLKKLKGPAEKEKLDVGSSRVVQSLDGLLLVDGIWRKVGEEELLAIESNVRILV